MTVPEATMPPAGAHGIRQTIAVTFCNQWQSPARIGFIDASSLRFSAIRLHAFGACAGMTGLAEKDGWLYTTALSTVKPAAASLVVVDATTLEVVAATELLDSVRDPHSLLVVDDGAYVVSTGTDEVVRLELDGPHVTGTSIVWRPRTAGPREDVHHVNSILEWGGRLVASGFGPKDGDLWATARNGFIWDLTRDEPIAENIYHPHSVTQLGATLGWCASATRTVELLDGRRSEALDGYVRGLAANGDDVFVGTSKGRLISKSEGTFTALGRAGGNEGSCRVLRLEAETLQVRDAVEVGGSFNEIFDVVPFDRRRG